MRECKVGEFGWQVTPWCPLCWFRKPLDGVRTLLLAGGGRQAPLLAEAGAAVGVLDDSDCAVRH